MNFAISPSDSSPVVSVFEIIEKILIPDKYGNHCHARDGESARGKGVRKAAREGRKEERETTTELYNITGESAPHYFLAKVSAKTWRIFMQNDAISMTANTLSSW